MTSEDMKALRRVNRILSLCRSVISPVVPVQIVQAFMAVALNEGLSLTEIAQSCGGNLSTASRHIIDLSDRNRKKEQGYGLVYRTEDAMEIRKNNYFLTPKGKLLASQLIDILKD